MRGKSAPGAGVRTCAIVLIVLAQIVLSHTGCVQAQELQYPFEQNVLAPASAAPFAGTWGFGSLQSFDRSLPFLSREYFRPGFFMGYGSVLERTAESDSWRFLRSSMNEDLVSSRGMEVFFNLNERSSLVPDLSISGSAVPSEAPAGKGVDAALSFSASKTLGGSESSLHRLHLNVSWKYSSDEKADITDSSYLVVVGYDHRMGPDMMVVFDFVREEDKAEERDAHFAEAGFAFQPTPLTVLSAGMGAGIMEDLPGFRARLSFQYAF